MLSAMSPFSADLKVSGSVVSSLREVWGVAPAKNEFWRIYSHERTHLIVTNLTFLAFLWHIFSHIHNH